MAAMQEREKLLRAIAHEEFRLVSLQAEETEVRARLERLRADLDVLGAAGARTRRTDDAGAPATAAEKVVVFRSLFRGRTDVFPRRWQNRRTGKAGYAPACANEWVRGVCDKPRIRCSECPSQAFVPVTDQEILGHLQGRHALGVYPLLEDETCWLLAVDLDGASWVDDARAFLETCRSFGLAASIERSRSGKGSHVWFFFSAPVAAATARRMGCALLTDTMARRHKLRMESYDRLFPSQDTLPAGGFGNLIALPLQLEARQKDNTVFLDDDFVPHPDQWAYLAGLQRIEPEEVAHIADEAAREGRIIGLRLPSTEDSEAPEPWHRLPSGATRRPMILEPMPPQVQAVLAQRLFVEKADLPAGLLNQIKRLAAFQNPEFYKKQSLRLSTALTPRVISCAEEHRQHISLPRGCRDDLSSLLDDHGVRLAVQDERQLGEPVDFRFRGQLTSVQEAAAKALVAHDTGVFVAPPGVGKTVIGIYLLAERARNTLVLVHRKPLMDQWVTQLSLFLGIPPRSIGRIGAGRRRPNGRLDVAMLQSLVRKGVVDDLVADYGHVIVDESHHVPAVTFERVLSEVRAKFVTSLTATPNRRDGQHPILHMQCGPIRYAVHARSPLAQRPFENRLILRDTTFQPATAHDQGIQTLYSELVADGERNALIVNDVCAALDEGRSPIVLTERKDHIEGLVASLRGRVRHLVVLHGGMSPKARREEMERLDAIPDDEERLLIATGRYIGEGFDDARLDTLFLTLPVSWKGTLVQYAGRLQRLHAGKTELRIYDYLDRRVPVLQRMFERRLRGYRAIGYSMDEAES